MNQKFKFLRKKLSLLDIGSYPGGWSQVASKKITNGKILAVDIKLMEKNILKPEMNLGDAILFNFKVLHSSPGNSENIPRRAFSMRFMGDDVKYIDRGGETSPPFKGIDLKIGAKMREDWFPVVWTN